MEKREQKFTTTFLKWLRARQDKGALPHAAVIEIKVAKKGEPLSFSAVKEHQIHALLVAKWHTFAYKISDLDRLQKPCDVVYMRNTGGLLVFYWSDKTFYVIDIDVFEQEKELSKRKSLTEERAKELAFLIGKI